MENNSGQVWPCEEEFVELAKHRRVIPVVRKVIADQITPVGLYRHLARDRAGTFLLESAEVDGRWSRYSIVGVKSAFSLTNDGEQAQWIGTPPVGIRTTGPVLDVLEDALAHLHSPRFDHLPPFTGGFVGFCGFDTVRMWENIPEGQFSPAGPLPDILLSFTTQVAVLDHNDGTLWLIANAVNYDGEEAGAKAAYTEAVARVDEMTAIMNGPPVGTRQVLVTTPSQFVPPASSSPHFIETVKEAKNAITAGEVFQVVLSQSYQVPCPVDSFDVYRALRRANPSPYMYLLRCVDSNGRPFDVVGASPEALIRDQSGYLTAHPIAGTRPRGATVAEDAELVAQLQADEKERAEHLMLVDLARNDLARVCDPASVEVTQFMAVHQFSQVSHLVSTVNGQRVPDASPVDVLRATFPAGTLSGAPKPRALTLINELEPQRRGLYGGVVGYFDTSGDLDLAIAIRTAVISGGQAAVQAGAGIVADSIPEAEDAECQAKASAVLRAIDAATRTRPCKPKPQRRAVDS